MESVVDIKKRKNTVKKIKTNVSFTVKEEFANRLKALRPKIGLYDVVTKPGLDKIYLSFMNILTSICAQFKNIPTMHSILIKGCSLGPATF